MRRPILFVLAAGPGLFLLPHAEADAAARLTAYMCQPLTAENRAMCCAALNREDIILPQQLHQCDRGARRREKAPAARRADNTPVGDDDDDDDNGFNPGNDKDVGKATEKDDKGFRGSSDPIGTRGGSQLHNNK